MKLASYPAHKSSGVSWLGDIAKDWDVRPIKYLVLTRVTDGPHSTPDILSEGIPFVSAEAINQGEIHFDKIRGYIAEEDHTLFSKKYKPKRGDIYLVKSGATTGRVAIVETDAEFNIWSPLAAIRCDPAIIDRYFLFYYMHSKEFQTGVSLSWSFGTQQNIGMGVIENLDVPIPSLPEQRQIVAFLDWKTGQIDALMALKKELLEKLKEKRLAVITQAVTRGLNPAAPLRDSGIAWLGQVPEHWEVKRLKFQAGAGKGAGIQIGPFGGMLTELTYAELGEFKLYGQENVLSGDFEKGTRWLTAEQYADLSQYAAEAGDFLFTRKGSIGGCAIVPENAHLGIIDSDTIRLRVNPQTLSTRFLLHAFRESEYLQFQVQLIKRGAILSGLNTTTIADLILVAPPLDEQIAIAEYLDLQTARINELAGRVEAAIVLLTEYRTALITAATTGKIDVRGVKIPHRAA